MTAAWPNYTLELHTWPPERTRPMGFALLADGEVRGVLRVDQLRDALAEWDAAEKQVRK